MDGSKLNRRVTFQTNTPTANSIGEFVDTWADTLTVWAAVKPLVGAIRFTAQQANSKVSGKVIVRYNSTIIASMRISYDSRYLKIISIVNPDEANQWLEIDYSEALD
jgi:SPP1 family predicted phage head-tail adaptor